jgi:hypothetical protein
MNQYPQQPSRQFQQPKPFQQPKSLHTALAAPFVWASRHPVPAILSILVLLLASFAIGALRQAQATSSASNQLAVPMRTSVVNDTEHPMTVTIATRTPTHPTKWTTVQTFKGNGTKKTTTFAVPTNWRIMWSCDLASHNNTNYNVIIHPNSTNNALLDNGVETTCNKNNTHNTVEVHKGGNIYLSIISEGTWVVQIQTPM